MFRKLTAAFAALALAAVALAPSVADAREHRGGYWGGHNYHGGYYGGRHYRHDDHGDAVAAGAVGLVLGLALGAAVSNNPQRQYGCGSRCGSYYAPPPPPPCGGCYAPGAYGQDSYYAPPPRAYDDRGYDPRYDDQLEGGYYDNRSQCTRQERQWDRYARRYVTVDVPC